MVNQRLTGAADIDKDMERLEFDLDRLNRWDQPGEPTTIHTAYRAARLASLLLFRCDNAPNTSQDRILIMVAHASAAAGYMMFDAGDNNNAKDAFQYATAAANLMSDTEVGASLRHRTQASRTRLAVHEVQTVPRVPREHMWSVMPKPAPSLTQGEHALGHRVAARVVSNSPADQDTYETLKRTIGQADQAWACHDERNTPPWVGLSGRAEHLGDTGQSWADYALQGDQRAFWEAVPRLQAAIDAEEAHVRTRTFSAITMATLYVRYGDLAHARALTEQALVQTHEAKSAQAYVMLKRLAREASASGDGELVELVDA